MLAVAVIVGFQGMARLFPDPFARLRVSLGMVSWPTSGARSAVCLVLLLLVDVWHYAMAGTSFFAQYLASQWMRTVLDRGAANDRCYYVRVFLRYWPWLPFVLVSVPLVVWKKDWVAAPALILGGLVTGGTFLGFTLLAHKAFWYVAIHYVGSSLMAALTLRYVVPEGWIQKHYASAA